MLYRTPSRGDTLEENFVADVSPRDRVRSSSLGCGVGLRTQHYSLLLSQKPAMDWFEAITENFMDSGGRPVRVLEKVRENYPVGLHGVSLSIGSADPVNLRYLERLKALIERIDPAIVSDHLCWTGVGGENLHDLLPLAFTQEALEYLVPRIQYVQEYLGRQILLENVSTYVTFKHSVIPEWEFITQVARRSGCGILLDVNNIFVNATNHKFHPNAYVDSIAPELVGQFHLAGHTNRGKFLFDTHSAAVCDAVWKLYERALERFGPVTTLIEWDEDVPEFARLAEEAERARKIWRRFAQDARWAGPAAAVSHGCSPRQMDDRHGQCRGSAPVGALLRVTPPPGVQLLQVRMRQRIRSHEPEKFEDLPLNPQGGEPGAKRMQVYAQGYVARLHEALGEIFPAVKHMMGDVAFFDLVSRYLEKYPSRDYNLNDAGAYLPGFISTTPYDAKLPFLPDLAKLEWLVSRAFHAFEEELFQPQNQSLEDPDLLRIVFQPSVYLFSSAWPVWDLWSARKTPVGDINIPLESRPQHVLVCRATLDVRCELIDEMCFRFMQELQKGQTLGQACEALAKLTSSEPAPSQVEGLPPVSDWFSRWVGGGLIARVEK